MYCLTNHAQGGFQIPVGGLEGVGVDGEWCSEDDKWRSVSGALDGLLKAETPDGLDGDFHCFYDFPQLV